MLDLSRVTLFAIDNTNRIEATIKSLHTSMQVAKFGAIKLVTSNEYIDKYSDELLQDGIECEKMVPLITNIDEYSHYILYELHRHIETDFVLISQDHAFIINPDAWTDQFLNYDYLGAPWPYAEDSYIDPFGNHHRVGNGGFSLRSRKFLEVPTKVEVPWETNNSNFYWMPEGVINYHEDGNVCVHNRHIFIEQGCKFPPVELAAKFSYESPVSENQGIIPFGFHYNLPPGVTLEQ
jgi:hypothetical protein